jgi:hypothetical protein
LYTQTTVIINLYQEWDVETVAPGPVVSHQAAKAMEVAAAVDAIK